MATLTSQIQIGLPKVYSQLSDEECMEKIQSVKDYFGDDLLMLGHHYQRDKVIQFADASGDSLKLAQLAAKTTRAKYIIFCGVHFMAEMADILTSNEQIVMLPDLNAGCTMADMANDDQVQDCWEAIDELFGGTTIPITYMNSTASLKAFCGRNGGTCNTSSNAQKIFSWALERGERILFFPDENLGRNSAIAMGMQPKEIIVYNQLRRDFEWLPDQDPEEVKVILWKGFCSIHQRFTVGQVKQLREEYPGIKILVHPECPAPTVAAADLVGSTEYIMKHVSQAPAGTVWGIGTEVNLVHRLMVKYPDQKILSVNPVSSPCCTMSRIAPQNLAWVLDNLREGKIVNQITVPEDIACNARLALTRMLELA